MRDDLGAVVGGVELVRAGDRHRVGQNAIGAQGGVDPRAHGDRAARAGCHIRHRPLEGRQGTGVGDQDAAAGEARQDQLDRQDVGDVHAGGESGARIGEGQGVSQRLAGEQRANTGRDLRGDHQVGQRFTGYHAHIVDGVTGELYGVIAIEVGIQLDGASKVGADVGAMARPTRALMERKSGIPDVLGHRGAQPLPEPAHLARIRGTHLEPGVVEVSPLQLILLRPDHASLADIPAQVERGRGQVLVRRGVVGVVQVGFPTVATGAVVEWRGARQPPLPLVLDPAAGEAAIVIVKGAAVDHRGPGVGGAGQLGHGGLLGLAADPQPPLQERARIAGGVIVELQRPRPLGLHSLEPLEPRGRFWLVDDVLDHREGPDRQGRVIVQPNVHLGIDAAGVRANVVEERDGVAAWRDEHHIQVGH